MNTSQNSAQGFNAREKQTNLLINVVSIAVPVVVAVLLGIRQKFDLGEWTAYLPHVIGVINTITSLTLITALVAIKQKKFKLHGSLMTTAVILGALFLVCYVVYHLTNESVRYGGNGWLKGVYLFVLISHIALSLVVLPLVLRAFALAVTSQFVAHRKIAKYAYPIWLYVSVTGVIVYAMVYPYHNAGH